MIPHEPTHGNQRLLSDLNLQHVMGTKETLVHGAVNLFSILIISTGLGQIVQFELVNRELILGVDAPVYDAAGIPLEGPRYRAEAVCRVV
jgi:hypothetical protein